MATDDIRDFGIAVADAKRLNECWRELSEAFEAKPSLPGDEAHWFTRASASPGNESWVHQVNSQNVAECEIRRAILDGSLPLWLRIAEGEVKVDHLALGEISHKTVAAGVYLAINYPKPFIDGRPLWVKTSDWTHFRDALLIRRYGVDAANSRVAALFGLWAQEARRDYEQERDRVNAEMSMHGLTGSGARIRKLTAAALNAVIALLNRTRSLSKGMLDLDDLSRWSETLVNDLLHDVRRSYQGSRLLGGDGGVLDSQAHEARERIRAELEKMRLEEALTSVPTAEPKPSASAPAPATRLRRGRTKGSGAFANVDAPLLNEMRELISSGQAQSPNAASMMVAARAFGNATLENKAARLAKAYRASERNGAK